MYKINKFKFKRIVLFKKTAKVQNSLFQKNQKQNICLSLTCGIVWGRKGGPLFSE